MGIDKFSEDREFSRRLLMNDTWVIEGAERSCMTHVLIGKEKALVIDPGENRRNIREYIQNEITDLPLCVAITHGSWDHCGSAGQFKGCAIYISDYSTLELKVCRGKSVYDWYFDYEPTVIPEDYIIDLGGRYIKTIAIGCHSQGSFAFLDIENKLLFTGDEIECGQVLINQPWDSCYATVERFRGNMLKLKSQIDQFDFLLPGHNGTPISPEYIDLLIENTERILSGIEGKTDLSSATYHPGANKNDPRGNNPNFRRSEWKGSSIVYDINKVFNSGDPDEAFMQPNVSFEQFLEKLGEDERNYVLGKKR